MAVTTAQADARSIGAANETPAWRVAVRDTLLGVLDGDCDEAVRFHALRGLGALVMPECVDTLALALEDADEDVRATAAEALSRQSGSRVEALLLRTLCEDPAPDCKLAAIAGLRRLGERGEISTHSVSTLIALCSGRGSDVHWDEASNEGWDDWLDVQIAAIRAIAAMSRSVATPAAVEGIERALHDEEAQELAAVACTAFAQLGTAGQAALQRCVAAPRERLRREAIAAMLQAPRIEHRQCLEALLEDAQADLRASALEALLALGQGEPHLAAMLGDNAATVVITALAHCTSANISASAINALARHQDVKVREATARTITRIALSMDADKRNSSAGILPTLLSDPKPEVLGAAVEAAAAVLGRGSMKLLTQLLNDRATATSVRAACVAALASIRDPAIIKTLTPVLTDEDWHVRRTALAAISACAADSKNNVSGDALLTLCALLETDDARASDSAVAMAGEEQQRAKLSAIPLTVETSVGQENQVTGQEPPALSTLQSILADNEHIADNVELVLEDDDAERLASASIKPRRRKHIAVEPEVSAALDAARFAARSLGKCPSQVARVALENALQWLDEEVVDAALDSLQSIGNATSSSDGLLDKLEAFAHTGTIEQRACASRLLMQLDGARGEACCRQILHSADVPSCRALLQLITQSPLRTDLSLAQDVVALFKIEQLKPSALRAIATINPGRVIDHLLPLIGTGDESVHQVLGSLLRNRELAAEPAAHALLAGLDDPRWTRERVWVLEMLERML